MIVSTPPSGIKRPVRYAFHNTICGSLCFSQNVTFVTSNMILSLVATYHFRFCIHVESCQFLNSLVCSNTWTLTVNGFASHNELALWPSVRSLRVVVLRFVRPGIRTIWVWSISRVLVLLAGITTADLDLWFKVTNKVISIVFHIIITAQSTKM